MSRAGHRGDIPVIDLTGDSGDEAEECSNAVLCPICYEHLHERGSSGHHLRTPVLLQVPEELEYHPKMASITGTNALDGTMQIIDLTGDDDGKKDGQEAPQRRRPAQKSTRGARCCLCCKYLKNASSMVATCGHVFCSNCLLGLMENDSQCSFCGQDLDEESIFPIYPKYKD
ncbi:GL25747 [Drosophila persimilis]|uniref:GL25747 n=1 Tax=Drosophila persimilis TaxID=7234 RepID=B4GK51_DROPE|nr:GL25747 [Drosophila persimilis]